MTSSRWAIRSLVAGATAAALALAATPAALSATPETRAGESLPRSLTITSVPSGHQLARVGFTQYASVFGVTVAAQGGVPRAKAQHAFNVLAEYLDNDGNGKPDNRKVAKALRRGNATMLVFSSWNAMERFEDSDDIDRIGNREVAILVNDEIAPRGEFDATLEEDLHLITQFGYARAYPKAFAERSGSQLRDLRKLSERRGDFHYGDRTCDQACMDTEYFYWSLTSLLGAQADRCREIADEWELCTPSLMRAQAPEMTGLMQKRTYRLPKVLPDGRYR